MPKCRAEAGNACVGVPVAAGELLRLWGMMSAEVATGAEVSQKQISALWSSWSGLLHHPPTS